MFKQVEHHSIYSIALLMSTGEKNSCEALAKRIGFSGDKMLRILEHKAVTSTELISIAKCFFKDKKVYLVIDDTLIAKIFAKYIEGLGHVFDPSNHDYYKALCSVVAMITDGEYALPINHKFWIPEEIMLKDYKSKVELAKELIIEAIQHLNIDVVSMDGLYANTNLMAWMCQQNVSFEIRFHANRVIKINGYDKPIKISLINELKLNKRWNYRTIKGLWKDMNLYFTSVKKEQKNGDYKTIYQVSNYYAKPKKHAQIYTYRWKIEKFFRTSKQYLGLGHCQSRKLVNQENHIRNVFLTYAFLQYEMKTKKHPNPETAFRALKTKNYDYLSSRFLRFDQTFDSACA